MSADLPGVVLQESLDGTASAVLSKCRSYRYSLRRSWTARKVPTTVTWVMLNPSTADALQDDQTIRKCVAFSKKWGYERLLVVNLFAWRSTSPKAMYEEHHHGGRDIVGPLANHYFNEAVGRAHEIIVAWGASGQDERVFEQRVLDVIASLPDSTSVRCLGLTKGRAPKHPLYLPLATERQSW